MRDGAHDDTNVLLLDLLQSPRVAEKDKDMAYALRAEGHCLHKI